MCARDTNFRDINIKIIVLSVWYQQRRESKNFFYLMHMHDLQLIKKTNTHAIAQLLLHLSIHLIIFYTLKLVSKMLSNETIAMCFKMWIKCIPKYLPKILKYFIALEYKRISYFYTKL